ncbi:MAG: nitroreductase family protein [Clostridia bacterium]|nr:nitroreductase family protein [Clostridia bacterium]
MKTTELISSRRSVRTFSGEPLREEDAKRITDFAGTAENPYRLPITWLLLDAKEKGLSSPVISGESAYIAGRMKREEHAEEAFGYSFEKIVLFAQSLGVGTTWIAGTMDRSAFEKAAGLSEGEVMPCVSPLGYPAKKMSLRETLMRKGVRADSRLDFTELFFNGSFDRPLTPGKAGGLQPVLEAVRLAPSAVNKQPWRIVVLGNRAHFYKKTGKADASGEWDIQRIDMGIALCHFELAALESGYSVDFSVDDPGLAPDGGVRYIATFAFNKDRS